jgi:hypothetical protein
MMGSDLFNWREEYPHQPRYRRNSDTSAAAAVAVKLKAATLRNRILAVLRRGAELTPDEMAETIGEDLLAVRPRFSELYRLGQIEKTGERRDNEPGCKAAVWRAVRS